MSKFLDIFYPKACFECKKAGKYFCQDCLKGVNKSRLVCPLCIKPSIDGRTHTKCQTPQSLDGLTSVWEYKGVVRKGVVSLKYKFAKDAGQELIQRFVEGLSGTVLPKKAVLVPVPMHKEREKWRGFNHALELGKLLCQQTGWEIKGDVLFKQRKTTPQTELRGTERKKNLRGVFDVGNKAKEEFLGKTVVIFDDVWTTGSTLKECTKVLKRNGAGIVWGLTLARTR